LHNIASHLIALHCIVMYVQRHNYNLNIKIVTTTLTHHTTTVLRPFSGTTRVSRCHNTTSGLYGARED